MRILYRLIGYLSGLASQSLLYIKSIYNDCKLWNCFLRKIFFEPYSDLPMLLIYKIRGFSDFVLISVIKNDYADGTYALLYLNVFSRQGDILGMSKEL